MKLWKSYWKSCGYSHTLQVGGFFISRHWKGTHIFSLEYTTENGMVAIGSKGLTVFDKKLADCPASFVLRGKFKHVCLRLGSPFFTFISNGQNRRKYIAALQQGERNLETQQHHDSITGRTVSFYGGQK